MDPAPPSETARSAVHAFALHELSLRTEACAAIDLCRQVGTVAGLAGHRLAFLEDPGGQLAEHALAVTAIAQECAVGFARAIDIRALGAGHAASADPISSDTAA